MLKMLCIATFALLSSIARADELVLLNANIVDPETRTISQGDIVIENGVIVRIEAGKKSRPVVGSSTIDLDGRWVMPSLIDAHVHLWGNRSPTGAVQILGIEGAAKKMLEGGQTAFLDLFNDEREIFPLRDKQRATGLAGADIFAAGPCLTAPKAHCSEMVTPTRIVESPAGAAAEVAEVAKMKPDVIKLVYDHAIPFFPTMDKSTMAALVDSAKNLNLKTVTHIGTWQDAREAIEAGTTAITHLHCAEVIPDDLVALIKSKGIVMIPTMTVQNELANIIDDPALLDDPLLNRLVTADVIAGYRNINVNEPWLKFFIDFTTQCRLTNAATLKKLADAGVVLLAGTDIGNFATFVGYSVHRELQYFVGSGLSTWQAIEAATIAPAKFLGLKNGVKVGSTANLLVVSRSPVTDIANTKEVRLVVQKGKVVVNRMDIQ